WWNVKHPAKYASLLANGESPEAGREVLTGEDRHLERIMLELRLAEGLPLDALDDAGLRESSVAADEGLLDPGSLRDGRAVLTDRGRLLADAVVRRLAA
ncbi:coproporphyrinogen III oxidase, partial [Amycolatopsis sp. RM579]|nr:coproporphyrinogen III oxidase [Amycolatopsis pithecellobii]